MQYEPLTAYHSSNKKLDVGTKLIPRRLDIIADELSNSPNQYQAERTLFVENLFEKIRSLEFPSKPSRLESVFASLKSEYTPKRDYIYPVFCDGLIHITDQEFYTLAFESKDSDHIKDLAREYWIGISIDNFNDSSELLIKGKVIVSDRTIII